MIEPRRMVANITPMPCYAFAVLNILRLKVLGRTVVTMLSNLRTAFLQDTNFATQDI